jgi:hypothetical protein
VGRVELFRPMNHVFIRQPGNVRDDPRHSKSRGGTAHCQVATDPGCQCKEARRIVRALTSTGCHIERIGRLDEKIHASVVRHSHCSAQKRSRRQAGQAHLLALGTIGTLDLVTVSGDAGALNELYPEGTPDDVARGHRGLQGVRRAPRVTNRRSQPQRTGAVRDVRLARYSRDR